VELISVAPPVSTGVRLLCSDCGHLKRDVFGIANRPFTYVCFDCTHKTRATCPTANGHDLERWEATRPHPTPTEGALL
jgi:hypothetical protein